MTLKFKGQGHGWGHSSKSQCGSNILSTHIPFVPCQSALPFLTYSIFKIWPWKSRVKVMGEVTIQSHNVGLTSYRLTSLSFHVNLASHYWVKDFFKTWPWNSRVKVMGEVTVQSHNVGLTSYRLTSLLFHVQGCQPVRNFRILYGFYMQNTGVRIWPRKYGNWALSVLSLKVLLPEQSLLVLGSKSVRICGILCLRTFKYLFNHQNIQSSLSHM